MMKDIAVVYVFFLFFQGVLFQPSNTFFLARGFASGSNWQSISGEWVAM
jgi:hypothetical protein